MLHKVGTVREIEKIKNNLPNEVYQAALSIVTALDDNYGEDRDVDENDGGFVLIAENVSDLTEANEQYIQTDNDTHEYVNLVKCEETSYINALYLSNNEFGVNVFLPKAIAPRVLLDDLEG